MRKSEVQFHTEGYGSTLYPAINVKCRSFPGADDIATRFGCDVKTAERAAEFAWNSAVQQFWSLIKNDVEEVFPGCKVYSEGRSGGWLIVEGLPEVESWDAIMLGKWSRLVKYCRAYIADLSSPESVFGYIEANQWFKPGAEEYNFLDRADGSTVCLADMKAEAIAAGFAPVVRR